MARGGGDEGGRDKLCGTVPHQAETTGGKRGEGNVLPARGCDGTRETDETIVVESVTGQAAKGGAEAFRSSLGGAAARWEIGRTPREPRQVSVCVGVHADLWLGRRLSRDQRHQIAYRTEAADFRRRDPDVEPSLDGEEQAHMRQTIPAIDFSGGHVRTQDKRIVIEELTKEPFESVLTLLFTQAHIVFAGGRGVKRWRATGNGDWRAQFAIIALTRGAIV